MKETLCAQCHSPVPQPDLVTYRKQPYHKMCLEEIKNKARANDVQATKRIDPDLSSLQKYICQLYGLPAITPYLQKQINNYYQDFHIPYADILFTLRYFFELCEGQILDTELPTIGIVPYKLEEAKQFNAAMGAAVEANKCFVLKEQNVDLVVCKKPSAMTLGYAIDDL